MKKSFLTSTPHDMVRLHRPAQLQRRTRNLKKIEPVHEIMVPYLSHMRKSFLLTHVSDVPSESSPYPYFVYTSNEGYVMTAQMTRFA